MLGALCVRTRIQILMLFLVVTSILLRRYLLPLPLSLSSPFLLPFLCPPYTAPSRPISDSGRRSCAVVLLHTALKMQVRPNQVFQWGDDLGMDLRKEGSISHGWLQNLVDTLDEFAAAFTAWKEEKVGKEEKAAGEGGAGEAVGSGDGEGGGGGGAVPLQCEGGGDSVANVIEAGAT